MGLGFGFGLGPFRVSGNLRGPGATDEEWGGFISLLVVVGVASYIIQGFVSLVTDVEFMVAMLLWVFPSFGIPTVHLIGLGKIGIDYAEPKWKQYLLKGSMLVGPGLIYVHGFYGIDNEYSALWWWFSLGPQGHSEATLLLITSSLVWIPISMMWANKLVTSNRKEKYKHQLRYYNHHKEITEQEIAANQKAHREKDLNSSLDESQLLMSKYSDLMTREGLTTIDELRARLGQSLKKVSDEILDNDTATTVTFSRHRMTEAKKRCNETIGELRILVEAAMDSTRDVQVSELELRNSFDLARKTLESYSLMSNVGVQQYKETISRFAVDISVKFGYLYL